MHRIVICGSAHEIWYGLLKLSGNFPYKHKRIEIKILHKIYSVLFILQRFFWKFLVRLKDTRVLLWFLFRIDVYPITRLKRSLVFCSVNGSSWKVKTNLKYMSHFFNRLRSSYLCELPHMYRTSSPSVFCINLFTFQHQRVQ